MKTVITATGNNFESPFDRRFGRAAWFCVYDDQNQEVTFHENGFADAGNGAGTKAAEKMVELKIGKVISGDFGPKAKDLLDKFEIQMVILQEDDIAVGDIIKRMQK
ncbi:MAG: NifB/NifX family molybdenum-iron cluster-binding protein [Bacteroidales bacterium]|nr:NifB/NifX family molybdenum-iron cluster-binding protein [Bacteroidales bacterium]